jgi:beta-galactosidase
VPVGKPVEVRVTSSAHSADLFVNGVRQKPPAPTAGCDGLPPVPTSGVAAAPVMPRYGSLRWLVPFTPGNLTAVAYDANGAVLATSTVLSAGQRSRLRVSVASPYLHGHNASEVAADGRDAALITVELIDAAGILVPNADLNVTFTVTGPGLLLGTTNGDPACHVQATSPRCPTFHGLLRGIIRSSELGGAGVITVRADADGVESGQVVLRAV